MISGISPTGMWRRWSSRGHSQQPSGYTRQGGIYQPTCKVLTPPTRRSSIQPFAVWNTNSIWPTGFRQQCQWQCPGIFISKPDPDPDPDPDPCIPPAGPVLPSPPSFIPGRRRRLLAPASSGPSGAPSGGKAGEIDAFGDAVVARDAQSNRHQGNRNGRDTVVSALS